jgi:hypothetical protein
LPKVDLAPLAELFRARILAMLKNEGRIDDFLIANLLTRRHNFGFSVHNGVRLARNDEDGREALAQYIIRKPFAVKKITYTRSAAWSSANPSRPHAAVKAAAGVWEVDPLACPKCGGEMKIVSFITEAAIIRRILEHLGLWTGKKQKAPAGRAPPSLDREKRYEPFDDGWPQYEEPFVAVYWGASSGIRLLFCLGREKQLPITSVPDFWLECMQLLHYADRIWPLI